MSFNTNPTQGTEAKKCLRVVHVVNNIQIGNDFDLKCFSWVKVAQLKQMICKRTSIPVSDMKLVYKNLELTRNNSDIQDYEIKRHSVIQLLPKVTLRAQRCCITPFEILDPDSDAHHRFMKLKWEVEASLNSGITPKLTDFGTQGTYILEGIQRNPLAVFKPQDEEAFAPNNPRGYVAKFSSPGLRQGVLSGEGVDREVAAFLIDYRYGGYMNVPLTTYVEFSHPSFKSEEFLVYIPDSQKTEPMKEDIPIKRGSFQMYVRHDDNAGNYGSSLFSVEEVHKLAILDIRILNCDRNEENVLVKKKKIQQASTKQSYDFVLIPIDHGYSFPDQFNICQDEVVWFHWDQIKQPFTFKELHYIAQINPAKDVQFIRNRLKFREICLRNFRIAGTLLKMGAAAGLTLYQIAQLLFRADPSELSTLERAVAAAEESYDLNLTIPQRLESPILKDDIPDLIKTSFSEKEESKQQNNQKFYNLPQINEEQYYKDEEDSPVRIKSVKRSISHPNFFQLRPKLRVATYTEEFFTHMMWFTQLLIEQKLKESKGKTPTSYRERFRSEDL